jgi:ABC-2 type transport system permease protein
MDSSGLFKIDDSYTSVDDIKIAIKNSKLSAGIIVPENYGSESPNAATQLKVIYDPGNATTNAVALSFLDQFTTSLNYKISGTKPIYSVAQEKTSDKELNYFDFVLVGILGLALMNSSVIGISVSMSRYREDKILKRITTTPLKPWMFITAEVLSRLIVNLIQIALILSIGIYAFNAHISGSIPILVVFSLLGAILFQLIGFTIASFAKSTDAAQGMTTAITIPMMFLAGVFFPIDLLPSWLYIFVKYLPLAPLLRIIRGVALESLPPFDNPQNILIVVAWIVIALIVSSYKFRLSDE